MKSVTLAALKNEGGGGELKLGGQSGGTVAGPDEGQWWPERW